METTETKNPKTTSVRVPPFVLLTALIIASTSHAALVKWCQARKDYKQQQVGMMLQHNKEEVDGAITSIKYSFTPGLLKVLCDLEWGIDIADITNDMLTAKFDDIIATVVNPSEPNRRTKHRIKSVCSFLAAA
ncbi:hypothetical protein PF003_g10770 [Phytophthora fragariae]|nr:hypothetical protein PF003_g10770 [Phytophthora fragariae]